MSCNNGILTHVTQIWLHQTFYQWSNVLIFKCLDFRFSFRRLQIKIFELSLGWACADSAVELEAFVQAPRSRVIFVFLKKIEKFHVKFQRSEWLRLSNRKKLTLLVLVFKQIMPLPFSMISRLVSIFSFILKWYKILILHVNRAVYTVLRTVRS